MRQRSFLPILGIALCAWFLPVQAGEPAVMALSEREAGMIVAALAGATLDEAGLAALPVVASGYLEHLVATTGIHCIDRNQDESYYGITMLVGDKARRQRHNVLFTVTPPIGHQMNTPDLASLLRGRTVTQYEVKPVGPLKPGRPRLAAYHARNPKPFCAVPPAAVESKAKR